LIESVGYEVDVRVYTQGQAEVQNGFSHWEVVPGDPLDEGAGKGVGVLERVEGERLAREFLIKTRRRKGLVEDVQVTKYLDDDMLIEIAKMSQNTR
jgi:U5 small nuclear ribonucleoprotein component